LPKPYLVSSGGGIHVYWPLTTAVDRQTWLGTAVALKALTKQFEFRVDQSRTADSASVLRPIGTANWKTGSPRKVELMAEGVVTDHADFHKCLAFAADANDTGFAIGGAAPSAAVAARR